MRGSEQGHGAERGLARGQEAERGAVAKRSREDLQEQSLRPWP